MGCKRSHVQVVSPRPLNFVILIYMRVTKLGHCCLLVEKDGKKILTDPGKWSTLPDDLMGISAVLLTHEHADHVHSESITKIQQQNPNLRIITNVSVKKLLAEWKVVCELIDDKAEMDVEGIALKSYEAHHANIYPTFPNVLTSSFLIDAKLFLPGDSFVEPEEKIEVLALPVSGPWLKVVETVDYAKKLAPKMAFAVHDGMLADPSPFHGNIQKALENTGVEFKIIKDNDYFEV